MVKVRLKIAAASLVVTGHAVLIMSGAAIAQDEEQAADAPVAVAAEPEGEQPAPVNPDEMADDLNSSQQLQQTITLRRTVDGEVIETEKRTVTFDRDAPYRETEAGETTVERLKARFDREALTRTEAFEEAKLDFILADVDRNEKLTSDEFAKLVDSWRKNETRQAGAPNQDIARQRQYDAFIEEIDPSAAEQQTEAYAKQKFAFMAGAAATISLQDYIREYLLDFDSMDADDDMILSGEELMRFRALNRGETLEM